jgi:hypothetical protein
MVDEERVPMKVHVAYAGETIPTITKNNTTDNTVTPMNLNL